MYIGRFVLMSLMPRAVKVNWRLGDKVWVSIILSPSALVVTFTWYFVLGFKTTCLEIRMNDVLSIFCSICSGFS